MQKQLTTLHLILSLPTFEDFSALNEFEKRNTLHLAKWESTPLENALPAEEATQQRLANWIQEYADSKSVRFFIRAKAEPDRIIGLCNFTQIFYGSFQACYLGYKIDHKCEGKGLMFEALQASIQYIFEELGLHRIMANYMPSNTRSAKLLQRLGFEIEGYAKRYLLINNRWEDHVLTALSVEQWKLTENHSLNTTTI